jgi:hypothetical protein
MEARRVRVEDCFPVDWNQKVVGKPISLSFSRDLLSQGWAMYADIVRRSSMADGGGALGLVARQADKGARPWRL